MWKSRWGERGRKGLYIGEAASREVREKARTASLAKIKTNETASQCKRRVSPTYLPVRAGYTLLWLSNQEAGEEGAREWTRYSCSDLPLGSKAQPKLKGLLVLHSHCYSLGAFVWIAGAIDHWLTGACSVYHRA